MENKYYVNTKYTKDMIDSSVMSDDLRTEYASQISRQVIQLQEEGVKTALHKLGYLNPDEVEEIKLDNLKLREALSDLIGGQHEYDLCDNGIGVGRARKILSLMRGGDNE